MNDVDNGQMESDLRKIFSGPSEFRLQEKLGEGSFGVVYKASTTDGSEYAIKIVRMDDPVSMMVDLQINNEILRAVGGTPYEQLFALPRSVLKIKRPNRDDQLALVMDKMEYARDG